MREIVQIFYFCWKLGQDIYVYIPDFHVKKFPDDRIVFLKQMKYPDKVLCSKIFHQNTLAAKNTSYVITPWQMDPKC